MFYLKAYNALYSEIRSRNQERKSNIAENAEKERPYDKPDFAEQHIARNKAYKRQNAQQRERHRKQFDRKVGL